MTTHLGRHALVVRRCTMHVDADLRISTLGQGVLTRQIGHYFNVSWGLADPHCGGASNISSNSSFENSLDSLSSL